MRITHAGGLVLSLLAILALAAGPAVSQQTKPGSTGKLQTKAQAKPKPRGGGKLPAPAGGKVEITEVTADVGGIEKGDKITHTFKLKNVGTGPLTIDAKPG